MHGLLPRHDHYLQAGLGWSVLRAGLVNIAFAVVCTVTAGLGATVVLARIGRRVLVLGAVVMLAGLALLAAVAHAATADTSWLAFVPGLAVVGAGFGFVVSSTAPLGLGQVPARHAGAASGLFNTTGQLCSAVGAAVLGTVFFAVASGSSGAAPAFGRAYEVVLGVIAGLLVLAALAAYVIPAEAHRHGEGHCG